MAVKMVAFQLSTQSGEYSPTDDPRWASFVAPVDTGSGILLEPDGAGGYDAMPYPPQVNTVALSRWLRDHEKT